MSLITLRDYQVAAVKSVMDAFGRGVRRPAISMATGSGKTVVLSQVIKESAQRSLIIAHRQEIVEQNQEKSIMVLDEPVGIVMAERNECRHSVISASIQTIANPDRLRQIGEFGLIIADEAHHSISPSWNYVLAKLGAGPEGDVRLVGVSATWDRTDGIGLDSVFDEMVFQIGMPQLINAGYLADIRPYRVTVAIDLSSVHMTKAGDYDQDELADEINSNQFPHAVGDAVHQYGKGRHTLVFAPRVDTAYLYCEAIRQRGVTAEVIHGNTPKADRSELLAQFRSGRLQAIVNVGVFVEGVDVPIIDCIVSGRPTTSRMLFEQMLGRGLRTYPAKDNLVFVDMVGVSSRLEIQTVATLFGINESETSVRKAVANKPGTEREPVFLASRASIQLNAQEVILKGFDRSKLLWTQIEDQTFALSAGDSRYVIKPHVKGSDKFDVLKFGNDRSRTVVSENLDVGYSQAIAEQGVMASESAVLAKRNASWRRKGEPATEKQINTLRLFRLAHDADITKADASLEIGKAMAKRDLRRA